MYKKSFILKLILASAFAAMFTACNIPKKLALPDLPNLPETYLQATADSNSAAITPWKLFFTDTILQQLVDTALVRNIDLLSTNQQIEIANANVFVSRAITAPMLEAVINTQADRYAFYTMNGIGNYDLNKSSNITPDMRLPSVVPDLMVGLRSQWEIDVWGKMKHMKKSAAAKYLGSLQGRAFLQTNVIAEVAFLYYELLGLDYELDVVKKNILLQQDALEIVKAQKMGGRATELAVHQFEALVFKTKAIEFYLKQQIAETENRLNHLLGRYPQTIRRGVGLQQLKLPVNMSAGVPSNLLLTRPDVTRAMHDLTAAYHDVAAARAMYYPSFNITAYTGPQGFRIPAFFNAQSVAAGVAGNIAAPIFKRRSVRGNYRISEAQAKQSWLNYNKTIQTAVMEVQTNMQGVGNLANQYALKQEEVNELSKATITANDLYASGYANYLEVITAQKSLVDAEIELTLLKKFQFQTMVGLYRSLGGGWR